MARSLIAVVNDAVPFLEVMEQLLEEEGYRVLTMNDAGQAYPGIKRQRPELVILDIRLGDPDAGWRVLELLRLDPALSLKSYPGHCLLSRLMGSAGKGGIPSSDGV